MRGVFDTDGFVAWGDSLTRSSGSSGSTHTYPYLLAVASHHYVENCGVGGETSTQIKARMLADTAKHTYPTIIWAGRNNYTSQATVEADIAAMVASLGHTRYLVLSVLNQDSALEYSGESEYAKIAALNAALSATYGARYVDVRSYLVSLYNPLDAQDVIDHGHDVPPTSLRSDAVHLNDAGYLAVANKVYESVSILEGN